MRTLGRLAGLAALLVASPAFAQGLGEGHKGAIPWVEDFEEGMAQAGRSGKPIILYFSADW